MFPSSNRFVTREIAEKVGHDIQAILWGLIDERKREGQDFDYLQVFHLTLDFALGYVIQKITHTQEVPPYSKSHHYTAIENPTYSTIWVIDSGDYSTMLFPNEY